MQGKTVVTGGSGRIGSAVVKRLLEAGHDVLNLDRRPPAEHRERWHYCDLRDRHSVDSEFRGASAIVHLGEIPNIFLGPTPADLFADNARVAANVLQSAADLQIRRVIYTSSCQVYGFFGADFSRPDTTAPTALPVTEAEPTHPANAYGAAKVAGETYGRMVCSIDRTMTVLAIRLPWVIGDQTDESIRRLTTGDDIRELGSYAHVDDVASAFELALRAELTGFHAIHCTAPDARGRPGVAERLATQFPHYPNLGHDWPATRCPFDCSKAEKLLGWRAHYSLHAKAAAT